MKTLPSKTTALLRYLAMTNFLGSIAIAGLAALSSVAHAQENKPDIQANTQIHKVVVVDGKESYIVTPVMGLDDVIQYTMHYHNSTEKPLSNIQVTFKIPKDMRYVGSSIDPQPTHAMTAGNPQWQKYPVLEFVSGRPKEVAPSSYDALAWTIARIEPKQTVRVVVRTKLVQRPTPVK